MKSISNKNKIILSLLILFIIAGIIMLCITGFEKSSKYEAGTRIEVYIPQGYEKQDIINIAKESFNTKYLTFEEIEKLNQVAGIKVSDYTEEELKSFKDSISEKYGIEEKELTTYEITIPSVKITTVITPYIFPTVLVTVLSLIYILFRNLKNEKKWEIILKIVLSLIFVLGIYFSSIVVLRLPFGDYTMPVALTIYILTLIISISSKRK